MCLLSDMKIFDLNTFLKKTPVKIFQSRNTKLVVCVTYANFFQVKGVQNCASFRWWRRSNWIFWLSCLSVKWGRDFPFSHCNFHSPKRVEPTVIYKKSDRSPRKRFFQLKTTRFGCFFFFFAPPDRIREQSFLQTKLHKHLIGEDQSHAHDCSG